MEDKLNAFQIAKKQGIVIGEPKCVLKTTENVAVLKKGSQILASLRGILWMIVGVMLCNSIFFWKEISGISWIIRIILLIVAVLSSFWNKNRRVSSDIELWFYENFLVVYREKRYYDAATTRQEFNRFYYIEIAKCEYNSKTKRLDIIGKVEETWFNYQKDGSLPEDPTYHKEVEGGICYFRIDRKDEAEIIAALERESYSHIKVLMKHQDN